MNDKNCNPQSNGNSPVKLTPYDRRPRFTGFIIIRLSDRVSSTVRNLKTRKETPGLAKFLDLYPKITTRRLISSVPPEKLLQMERNAKKSEFPPLHSLISYWRLDCRALETPLEELQKALQQLSEVEHAYLERVVSQPAVNASDNGYAVYQEYLDQAQLGIDARWAWAQANGEGAGVGFVDLERGWNLNHEDLIAKTPSLIFNDNIDDVIDVRDHGTAVLGIVGGVDNKKGIVGVAPGVTSVRVVSEYEAASETDGHVADAIVAAISVMAPGDVLLLEAQRDFLPTEIDEADFTAIRLAVAHGIIVVEAAGNGNADLDALPAGVSLHGDSGAIMVGSCESTRLHNRYVGLGDGSNFGSRIDCFAWGEDITTAGFGDLDEGTDDNNIYTCSFDGTSGAAAIIAGAALIIQGMYQATPSAGGRLSPLQMRTLLSDSATGTPQGPRPGRIGVMPNLRSIIERTLSLTPDVYLRDDVGDTGVVPSSGSLNASPDIIVRPVREANPTASFGEGSGYENSNTLSSAVESGQDNYIYVRMRNRSSTADANNTTATVYWSELSTLVTPDRWNLIGTSAGVNVPAGDTLVVTDPIVWRAKDIPAAGHYCFLGILNQESDLAPLLPPATDWDGFVAFIRNHNNVTWCNFNVVNEVADPSILSFMIAGAPDLGRDFDLEIIQRLPLKAEAVLEVPLALLAHLPRNSFRSARVDRKAKVASLSLPHLRCLPLRGVRLKKGAEYRCRLILEGLSRDNAQGHSVAIRQIFEEQEVGRVTWFFQPQRGERKKT
jgi:serine protease